MPAIPLKPLSWEDAEKLVEQCQSTATTTTTTTTTTVQQRRPGYKYHSRTRSWTKPRDMQAQAEGGGRAQEPVTGRRSRRSSSCNSSDGLSSKDLSKLRKVGCGIEDLEAIDGASDEDDKRSPLSAKEKSEQMNAEYQESLRNERKEARGV